MWAQTLPANTVAEGKVTERREEKKSYAPLSRNVGHHGDMKILEKPVVALKWATPDAEWEIETAGRVCWTSWGRSDGTIEGSREFIRRLKRVGHMDVMEEAELSVWIECSRTASHQIVRHRTQHHLQASQRYIKASEMEIMLPPSIAAANGGAKELFVSSCRTAYEQYDKLLSAGIRKEDARFVLPNAALTKMKAKGNLSNWRRFIDLRSDSASQWEIRMISNTVLEIANEIAPSIFEDQIEKYTMTNTLYADRVDRSYFEGNL